MTISSSFVSSALSPPGRAARLETLQSLIRAPRWGRSRRLQVNCGVLDALFPAPGLMEGMMLDWLGAGEGVGVSLLPWLLIRQLQQTGYTAVLVDSRQEFYPPGAAQLGVDLDRLVVVVPACLQQQLWTIEQSLRCSGDVVVLSRLGRIPANTYRRLKLAAEKGNNLGMFLRDARLRTSPSWADLRFLVEPAISVSRSRRMKVKELTQLEGTVSHSLLELCDESGHLSLVSQLVDPATSSRLTRAS